MSPMADETKDIHSGSGFETKDVFHPGMYAPAAVPNTDLNTTDHADSFNASEAEAPASDDSTSTARKTAASKASTSK